MLRRLVSVLKRAVFLLVITPVCTEVLSMSSQSIVLKTTEELALQMFLLFLVGIGTVANILLLVHNLSPIFTGSRLRPTQVIVTNLALTNALLLLATAFPSNIMVFAPRSPPSNLRCKIVLFIRLAVRSTNMCSTSALSIHQFLTLVPGHWGRLMLQGRTPDVLSYSCYSCWFFSFLNHVYIPIKITGPQSTINDTNYQSRFLCSTSAFSVGMVILHLANDATFISIMAWTSVSMVLLLHRHHQRTQHILTPTQNHRGHAETRAAQTVLMVVVTFVALYFLNFICLIFHVFSTDRGLLWRPVCESFTAGFPTISPLLLLFRDPKGPCSVLFNC